jgi:hypothetical protein
MLTLCKGRGTGGSNIGERFQAKDQDGSIDDKGDVASDGCGGDEEEIERK